MDILGDVDGAAEWLFCTGKDWDGWLPYSLEDTEGVCGHSREVGVAVDCAYTQETEAGMVSR
jgi:hypothetical protein